MADPKDKDASSGTAAGAARRAPGAQPAPDAAPQGGGSAAAENAVGTRETQYIIGPRVVPGSLTPLAAPAVLTNVLEKFRELPGYREMCRLKPRGVGLFAAGAGAAEIAVASTSPELGKELEAASRAGAPFVAERNRVLNHHGLAPAPAGGADATAAAALPGSFELGQISFDFSVVGADHQPLEGAQITLTGRRFTGEGVTDRNGKATVAVFGERPSTILSLYVKPLANHWERFIERPALNGSAINTIVLQPLSATFPNFPAQPMLGWGQEVMGLGQIPSHLTGQGVKIAIIDSGCDNTHPLLAHIKNGIDLTNQGNTSTWARDQIAHGTHCAGVIAGSASAGQGVRGFAPGAEVHIFKVFPGGRFSSLIDALDICIERQIDVVNCSLGSGEHSELVQNKIEEARQRGVACVVAAGNSSGPVQFPATLPTVLSVSALGQEQRFPTDSQHARTVVTELVGLNGVFPARFSCFGPQIRVSGPGVAIVSTVPGGGYAAWDGTSMAAPHVTGLAALVLAHHPAFHQPALRARTAARVDSLFQLLVAACAPMVADPARGGAGLPQATRALGALAAAPAQTAGAVAAGPAATAQFPQAPTDAALLQALAPVIAALAGGMPAGGALGALMGQTLANGGAGFGGPFAGFPGVGFPGAAGFAAQPGFGFGVPAGMPPQVLAQLRSLGLA
ncbi:hypothetical protein GCM10009416_05040 [Craurococcus roseus]|uniref:Peptidase S8/S53 domain-containing protein n=1 Tax=Craurococcus roseus TaxID=77585 RepID=A0ABN1EMA4_9PROT